MSLPPPNNVPVLNGEFFSPEWMTWLSQLSSGGGSLVGDVIINTTGVNPQTTKGGTWVQYAEGRCLLGAGSGSGLTTRVAGTEGGREDSHLPEHSHSMTHTHTGNTDLHNGHQHDTRHGDGANDSNGSGGATGKYSGDGHNTDTAGAHSHVLTIDDFTGDTGNSGTLPDDQNMIPYIVVYFWRKTA